MSDEAKDLISRLIVLDPAERLTANEVSGAAWLWLLAGLLCSIELSRPCLLHLPWKCCLPIFPWVYALPLVDAEASVVPFCLKHSPC